MKFILTLITLLALVGCASKSRPRKTVEYSLDGLRQESLKRYKIKHLDNKNLKNKNLAQCHKGQYNEALTDLKSQIDSKSNKFNYWNQISTCYILKKEYSKAEYFLKLANSFTKSKKHHAIILNNFGVINLEKQNYQKAIDYFKAAIDKDKYALTPKYNLSQIFLKFGLYKNSEKILNELLRAENKDIDFLNSYAHLKLMQKKYNLALKTFYQIPTEYHSRDDIATNLAMTYLMMNKRTKAKEIIDNAKKQDPHYIEAQEKIILNINS